MNHESGRSVSSISASRYERAIPWSRKEQIAPLAGRRTSALPAHPYGWAKESSQSTSDVHKTPPKACHYLHITVKLRLAEYHKSTASRHELDKASHTRNSAPMISHYFKTNTVPHVIPNPSDINHFHPFNLPTLKLPTLPNIKNIKPPSLTDALLH